MPSSMMPTDIKKIILCCVLISGYIGISSAQKGALRGYRGSDHGYLYHDYLCEDNHYYDEYAYRCQPDSDRFVFCYGKRYMGKFKCPKKTDCQCDTEGFNPGPVCGTDDSPANCVANLDVHGLCDANKWEKEPSFVCIDKYTYVMCDGDRAVDRRHVPEGTDCECFDLTESVPWGSFTRPAVCEHKGKITYKKGDPYKHEGITLGDKKEKKDIHFDAHKPGHTRKSHEKVGTSSSFSLRDFSRTKKHGHDKKGYEYPEVDYRSDRKHGHNIKEDEYREVDYHGDHKYERKPEYKDDMLP